MTKRPFLVVTLAIALICLLTIAYAARYVLLTAMIGIGVGVLLSPVLSAMQRRMKLPRGVSGMLVFLGILGVMAAFAYGIGAFISGQFDQLSDRLPEILKGAQSQLTRLASKYPWLQGQIGKFDLAQAPGIAIGWAIGGARSGAHAVGEFLVILALALYTSIKTERYFKGTLSLFPAYLRPKAAQVLKASACSLRQWFTGQLLDMAAVAVVTCIGLWAIGVDYWLVLGLMTGALDIMPYVGPILSAAIVCLMVLGSEPELVPWVLGLFLVIQQLEGNILLPIILRERAEIPEVQLIVLIIALGSWFGLAGALVAAPLLAVFRAIYLTAYLPIMDAKVAPARNDDAASLPSDEAYVDKRSA